jgi:hypothetical protein
MYSNCFVFDEGCFTIFERNKENISIKPANESNFMYVQLYFFFDKRLFFLFNEGRLWNANAVSVLFPPADLLVPNLSISLS